MSLYALPVSVSDLTQLQQGIEFFTNTAEATAAAAQINAGSLTVFSYAKQLLADNVPYSQVAMGVDSLMFGVTDTVAELTKLSTQFLPPQVHNALVNGYNPTVYAAEALGLALAGGNGTSNAFATNFGSLSESQFALAVASLTNLNTQAIQGWVNNWTTFYTAHPPAGGLSVQLAAYGAAFGDAVGTALINSFGAHVQDEVSNALIDNAEGSYVVGVEISALPRHQELQGEGTNGQTFTLTPSQDTFTGTGNNTINAPLSGVFGFLNQPTLTNGDSLTFTGPNNVLNATFHGDWTARSLNITGIQTWNIDQTGNGTIELSGDGTLGPNFISGLMVLNFNDDETHGSLSIGDNSSPVLEPNGANGFTINVTEAFGDGVFTHSIGSSGSSSGPSYDYFSPGVDVDIAAASFHGNDTINVTADVVGGFDQTPDGSYIIPVPIRVEPNDGDDYDPNWLGFLADAYGISAGASSGPFGVLLPPGGAVGFTNWSISSIGALAAGSLNIIALGGEGSWSAKTITLSDDGSNTMLFATAISDSLSTDWQNVQTITLTATKGFVTITGLETDIQEVTQQLWDNNHSSGFGFLNNSVSISTSALASAFQFFDGGGLLASDTGALTAILGGAGNSFYDLSSLTPPTPTTTTVVTIDGGHGTAGNSEVAFNNAVMTALVPTGDVPPIAISHIQILDDVSSIGNITVPVLNPDGSLGTAILENGGEAQGGLINMLNFAGLAPLNVPYALLAEGISSSSGYTVGGLVPSGLPFTTVPAGITAATPIATDLQNGVIPAGFEVLQLLNAEGSTQTVLGAKLVIENGPVNFAINMQDTADGTATFAGSGGGEEQGAVLLPAHGTWTGFDITITEGQVNPTLANTLVLFVSDDGVNIPRDPPPAPGGGEGNITVGTASYVPELTIDNYSTVDIVLPVESVGTQTVFFDDHAPVTVPTQNYVILGAQDPLAAPGGLLNGPGFIDTPIVTVQNAVVNFYDNNADNGGSPPGGEDDLVLGFTNFTGTLSPTYIGVVSVQIDTVPLDFATTINDFSTGSLEIGATNVTNLNAQSTSHLIMDLPATLPFEGLAGITVNGSLIGQNLLQGTSGLVMLDPAANGHNPTGADTFAVLEAISPLANQGGWGNDTLTGGDGFGTATVNNVGGVTFTSFTHGVSNGTFSHATETAGALTTPTPVLNDTNGPGNTGDNFFGEGGNDIVNIAAGEVGTLTAFQDILSSSGSILTSSSSPYDNSSTVWVGFYDVCNSAGENNVNGVNTGVGTIYDQAITDLSPGGVLGEETFVDGYGNTGKDANDPTTTSSAPVVTINGFHFGTGNVVGTNAGDTIVFGVADWAVTPTGSTSQIDDFTSTYPGNGGPPTTSVIDVDFTGTVAGLVESDGNLAMAPGFATYADVGTGGAFASVNGTAGGPAVKVVEDSIGGSYLNATALQNALANHTTSFVLAGTGVAAHTEADILVAYQLAPTVANPGGAIAIADVTLTNATSAATTDVVALNPVVHDLVHINTTSGFVGVANFFAHNVDFVG
jgi:hypothetical protein